MHTLRVNGLEASVHLPDAPEGEGIHKLPPCCIQQCYVVDEYPGCPDNWEHGSSLASSYFMKMEPGKHLWFDFRMNRYHSHHIAIVASIQGINPITGQKTRELNLQQYKHKCPVHDIKFQQDRYCSECEYKWPAQNYMTTTAHPLNHFWIDGFRADEGKVQGFLITEDSLRGVAAQMIGKERVWAIGLAFYLSKKPKPQISSFVPTRHDMFPNPYKDYTNSILNDCTITLCSMEPIGSYGPQGLSGDHEELTSGRILRSRGIDQKKIEIAAGAAIEQELNYPDPEALDFWNEEPTGLIYLNHCGPEQFESIIKVGKKDLTANGKGFMKNIKVGN